ncbi:MAG: hypothetical protein JWO73_546 [Candidatus Taylorbacteria bacterium]|nr:hypothetical protein [Candidatus Taylorbacteria bacterium]
MKKKLTAGKTLILACLSLVLAFGEIGCQLLSDGWTRRIAINSKPVGWVRVNEESEWHLMPYTYTFTTVRNRDHTIHLHFQDEIGRTCNRDIVCLTDGRMMTEGGAVLAVVGGIAGGFSVGIDKSLATSVKPSINYFLLQDDDYPKPHVLPAPAPATVNQNSVPIVNTITNFVTTERIVTNYVRVPVRVPVYEGPPVFSVGPIESEVWQNDSRVIRSRVDTIRFGPDKHYSTSCKPATKARSRLTGELDTGGN